MPVRFACPHCRQKLSVSSRKAGREANCPRCHKLLTIPAAPPEVERPRPQIPDAQPAANNTAQPETAPVSEPEAAAPTESAAASFEDPPHLDYGGPEDFELVFDTSDDEAVAAPAPSHPDLIAVPRLVLYLQGGLLAVVALVSFVLGLMAGGAFSGGTAQSAPRALTLEGTINYASGNRNLPDHGAVVAVIPESGLRPQRKAPVSGLRPDDATPDENHHGIAVLRELGGGYARTDDHGRFQVRVPGRGKYLVLVISSARQVHSLDDIQTADLLKLGPFFDNAAGLLGRQQYRLTSEIVRNDRQLNVVFE
ncbi:MAG: hypothetical protein L0211_22655 [Planctomycetaceae bacterium]|nr:hypothetical protein [Planctomycetaceae bacterium]